MKKVKKSMLLLMVILVSMSTACSKDDTSGGDGNAPSGTLVAKVDGTSYKSMEISSSATVASLSKTKNLTIVATNSQGKSFTITIFGYTGAGTYPLGGTTITNTATYMETDITNPTNTTIWQAPYEDKKAGEVVIKEETADKVIGTFEFKAQSTTGSKTIKTVTEGAFNLKKQTT